MVETRSRRGAVDSKMLGTSAKVDASSPAVARDRGPTRCGGFATARGRARSRRVEIGDGREQSRTRQSRDRGWSLGGWNAAAPRSGVVEWSRQVDASSSDMVARILKVDASRSETVEWNLDLDASRSETVEWSLELDASSARTVGRNFQVGAASVRMVGRTDED
jgi:hypothetical protein